MSQQQNLGMGQLLFEWLEGSGELSQAACIMIVSMFSYSMGSKLEELNFPST